MENNQDAKADKGKQGAEIKEFGTTLAPSSPIHIVSIIGADRRAYEPAAPEQNNEVRTYPAAACDGRTGPKHKGAAFTDEHRGRRC